MIACANCKMHHDTVADVRACCELHYATVPGTTIRVEVPKACPIDVLRGYADKLPDVAHARYAVERNGVWKFYVVDRPQSGKWAGRTFVKVMGSETAYRLRFAGELAALAEISKEPLTAMADYGRQLGKCGACQRILTDPISIEAGLGPICRAKLGV